MAETVQGVVGLSEIGELSDSQVQGQQRVRRRTNGVGTTR